MWRQGGTFWDRCWRDDFGLDDLAFLAADLEAADALVVDIDACRAACLRVGTTLSHFVRRGSLGLGFAVVEEAEGMLDRQDVLVLPLLQVDEVAAGRALLAVEQLGACAMAVRDVQPDFAGGELRFLEVDLELEVPPQLRRCSDGGSEVFRASALPSSDMLRALRVCRRFAPCYR